MTLSHQPHHAADMPQHQQGSGPTELTENELNDISGGPIYVAIPHLGGDVTSKGYGTDSKPRS